MTFKESPQSVSFSWEKRFIAPKISSNFGYLACDISDIAYDADNSLDNNTRLVNSHIVEIMGKEIVL